MTTDSLSLNISVSPRGDLKVKNDKKISNKQKPERNDENIDDYEIAAETKGKKKTKKSSLFKQSSDVVIPQIDGDFEPVSETLFSDRTYKDISSIHPYIVSNLEQYFGITKMTTVQQLTIPVLLSGKDALVRSQTGSGKTLAYAVPILHSLQNIRPKISRTDGVRALVILPTRELALQTYECFLKLVRAFARIVPGILVGGEKRKSEKARLRKGVNILIGTPGRVLDHAQHTASLDLSQVSVLVLDEGDKLLDMGYEKDVASILEIIEKQRNVKTRQTVLLSATLSPGVERLAGLALDSPKRIDSAEVKDEALVVPESLQQLFILAAPKLRLVTLSSFLLHICQVEGSSKVLIFVATQDMVDYFTELLPRVMDPDVEFFKLHGNMTQSDRTEVFKAFRATRFGVLLSTDVCARGLDLPHVDWIVQYTAPSNPEEYVHRVGRTARVGTEGNALIFLAPSETQFLQWLADKKIRLKEVEAHSFFGSLEHIEACQDSRRFGGGLEGLATALQHSFEDAVADQSGLRDLACKAYTSWVRFYASYPKEARNVFNFKALHLGHHAKSFALRDPPSVIGGIGKPKKGSGGDKNKKQTKTGRDRRAERLKKKGTRLKFETTESRTKRLVLSEFESGLPPVKKQKMTH